MAGLTFSPSTLETALAVPQDPDSITQAAGLAGVGPSSADIVKARDQAFADLQTTAQAVAGMRRPPAAAAGAPAAGANPQSIIAFSPSANKFYAGGLTFSPDDVPSALQASQRLGQPTPPAPGNIAGDWQFVSPQDFGQYMQGLRAPRGLGENLALGFRSGFEGAIGGVGRLAEIAGATEVGPAIAGFAEKAFGQTPSEQARSALIQQNNSLWSNILDATAQGAGSLVPTILGSVAGAAIGGPVGAAFGVASGAARTTGAVAGAAASIYPMELKGFYDAAQKNGYDVTDSRTQVEMLAAAAGTTLLQSIAPAAVIRGFSQPFREAVEVAGQEVARGALRNAATGAAKASLQEGFAEAMSSLAQSVVFDPEFRRKMNANDWKAIGPYVAEKYGEDALISFGAGALLGGALGGAANFRRTEPVNLSDVAGEQAGAKEAEQAAETPTLPPSPTPETPTLPPSPTPTMDETLAAAWEQQARMAIQPDQLGLAPYGESAAIGDAWLRAVTPPPLWQEPEVRISPRPSRSLSVAGLPLFDAAAAQPLQVAPGTQFNLFPNLPTQVAPAPVPGPGVQLGLPLEGQQLAFNLQQSQQAPAPLPTISPSTPAATPAQRAAAFEATRPTEGALAPGLRRLLAQRDVAAAEAQRARQEQEAVAARTAAAEPEMRAQAALEERTILDTEGASTTDKVKNAGRRKTIAGFNNLTAEQQNRVLAEFDNDTQQFFNYIKATTAAVARKNLARIAGVEPEAFNVETPTPAEPQPAAQPVALRRGEARATEKGKQPKDGQLKRKDAGKGRAAPEAGRGDSLKQGGQKQAAEAAPEVAPAKKPVRKPKPPAPKEAAVQRPPEGEAAPSPKPAAEVAQTEDAQVAAAAKDTVAAKAAADKRVAEIEKRIREINGELLSAGAGSGRYGLERINSLKTERDRLNAERNEIKYGDTTTSPTVAELLKTANTKGKGETGRFSLRGYNTVTGAVGLDGKDLPPMAAGRVRLGVRRFLSKLATKPNATIYKNQADLKARNPALYKQAKAALAAGVDFDAAPAAGYSFGDGNVIIFSDRIVNEQHLNFVLAHETLGHFGMRGIMPGDKFNALMERLYDENPRIKAGVDSAMEARGLRKAEAVEEYLSDYAGLLETSVIKRVWDSIKGFLNKLGIRFGDEAMRYFLDQAKRYVRQGQQGVTFDAQAVADRLMYVENGANDTGRFSVASVRTVNERISSVLQQLNNLEFNIPAGLQALKDLNLNRREGWVKLQDQFLRLSNFKALDNPGAYAFDQLMNGMRMKDASVYNKYNERLATLFNAPKAHQDNVSRVLYGGRRAALARFDAAPQLPGQRLVKLDKDGIPRADRKMIADLLQRGRLSFEEARDGVRLQIDVVDSLGNTQKDEVNYPGVKNLTKEQYADYVRALEAMADVEAELLEAKYANLLANETLSRDAIKRVMKSGDLTTADTKFVDDTIKEYKRIYTTGMAVDQTGSLQLDPQSVVRSNEFIAAVNTAILGERTDRNAAVAEFFADTPAADAYIDRLNDFKTRRSTPEALAKNNQTFTFQNEIKNIVLASADLDKADRAVKGNIVKGYIPVLRQGGNETRVQAFIDGKPVTLAQEYQDRLSYSQFESASDAVKAADKLNEFFKDKTFDVIVIQDGAPVSRKVKLAAKAGQAIETTASDPSLNLEEFLYGLRLFGINPAPTVMADILTTLTDTSNSARRRLQYSQTPGADPTLGITAMSQHIRSRGSSIAKTLFRPDLRQIMDRTIPETAELWAGGRQRVIALKKQVDAAKGDAKKYAQRELDLALRMYRKTNPDAVGKDGKPWDGSAANEPAFDAKGEYARGNRFYNEAADTLNFLDNNKYVTESNFESGKAVSHVRAFTTIMQLGGSVAQGVMNLASPYTNWIPYMATYNAKNGFGGGFSLGKVQAEYHRALAQVGLKGLRIGDSFNTAEFYDKIATNQKLQTQYGLNAREAKFLAREIREGKLIPAQSNALLATSLGHFTSPGTRKFVDAFMTPFNLTEQAARRAAGLAAYRMEYDRAIASGKSEAEADSRARDFAVQSIDFTLGEYAVLNRPPAWRQGLVSFLYMYKTYPTTVVQLLGNLSPVGRLGMLAALWVVSGVGGLPFAEDAEDLIDTAAQKFGSTSRGIRVEISKLLEDIMPGVSPLVLKGAAATWLGLPADIGSRFGMGDLIPGTGISLAGAKATEELKDIAGPAPSAVLGTLQFAIDLVQVPFSERKTLEDVARAAPITALRMLGDSSAYLQTGAIVDKRGYVVSQDMSAATIITRLLGFYPKAAADQYEVIKYANRMVNYQKETTTGFRQAWIKAKLRGDDESAAAIEESVRSWNDATRGTGLEIRNFTAGSFKALREARRPAGERALRAAPTAARQDVTGIMDAFLN